MHSRGDSNNFMKYINADNLFRYIGAVFDSDKQLIILIPISLTNIKWDGQRVVRIPSKDLLRLHNNV